MAYTVFSGLVMLWRLAGCPTRTSPSSVKATMDGVVRPPSAFSITLALFPSITATQELVVPRSMPIAFAMIRLLVQKLLVNGFPRFRWCSINRRDAPGGSGGRTASASRCRLGDSSGGLILLLGLF